MKLALLQGCNGSGKGYVTENLQQPCQVILIDHVRSDVLSPLHKLLIGDARNRWPIWDALIQNFDVVPAMTQALQQRYPSLGDTKSLVAEGGLLAHAGFYSSFLLALGRICGRPERQRRFWIDPAPDQILSNRQQRKRESDRNVSLEGIKEEVRWYRSEAQRYPCEVFIDAASTAAAIDEFLSEPRANS